MARVIPIRSLSKTQRRKLHQGDHGEVAEELAADEFGLLHRAREEEWYDVRAADRESRSTKGEVKSCREEVGEKYPAAGRFRLRRDQHRSLTASDGQGTAWYIFVLWRESTGDVVLQRRRPSTVTQIVADRGGWNRAGHEEFDEQHKLSVEEVLDVDA